MKACDVICGDNGMRKIPQYRMIKCAGSTCSTSECCEADATKCAGVSALCDTNSFEDRTKAKNAAAVNTYQNKCCSAKTTCHEFKDKVRTLDMSFAILPQVHAVAFFVAIGLFIAGK